MWKVFNLVNQEQKDVHQLEVHTFLNALFYSAAASLHKLIYCRYKSNEQFNVQHIKAQNTFYCIWQVHNIPHT
jgi:hypothetical protein